MVVTLTGIITHSCAPTTRASKVKLRTSIARLTGCRACTFVKKLVLRLFLGVKVTEADIINPQFEVLPMLHDSHRVVHDMK